MAAVDMFLKIDGIKGESQDKTHKEEIELLSFSWGVSNAGSGAFGMGSGSRQGVRIGHQCYEARRQVDTELVEVLLSGKNGG